MNHLKLLIQFLNQVLPTYQEPVGTKQELPYISLGGAVGGWDDTYNQQITIWTRNDDSYKSAYEYADQLANLIGNQGTTYQDDSSLIYINKGSPFIQNRVDDEATIRAVQINLEIHYF